MTKIHTVVSCYYSERVTLSAVEVQVIMILLIFLFEIPAFAGMENRTHLSSIE